MKFISPSWKSKCLLTLLLIQIQLTHNRIHYSFSFGHQGNSCILMSIHFLRNDHFDQNIHFLGRLLNWCSIGCFRLAEKESKCSNDQGADGTTNDDKSQFPVSDLGTFLTAIIGGIT